MNKKLMAGPYILWMVSFTVLPLATIVYYAFTARGGGFTLANVLAILEPIHLSALGLSLLLALGSTLVCLLLAYPLVLILVNRSVKRGSFIIFLFILPMWMNYMLRTLALQMLLSNNGVINSILSFLHLPEMSIINTPIAIMIGMVYDFLPFMILPIYNAVSRIDRGIVEAAYDLGAGYWTVVRRVIFPLSLPGVISGITMVFIPAISEFVIADMLGGGKILLIGNVIEQEFTQGNNWFLGSGLSLVLMVFILLTMLLAGKYDKEERSTLW